MGSEKPLDDEGGGKVRGKTAVSVRNVGRKQNGEEIQDV